MVSHLSTLIYRVRLAEEVVSINEMDDSEAVRFLGGRLINLVEYMRYWEDFDEAEAKEAREILCGYDMDPEMDEAGIEGFLRGLYGEPNRWSRSCVTCGKALSNPTSIRKGQGPTCRRKTSRLMTSEQIAEMIRKGRGRAKADSGGEIDSELEA